MPHTARAVALISLLACATAQAGRPLVSETADANAPGACDVESAFTRDSQRDAPDARSWDTVLACGIGHDTQLAAGYTRARSEGQTTEALRLGGKTALLPAAAGRSGWGLAYGVEAVREPGLSMKLEELQVVALATRELAPGLLGHANLGWGHRRTHSHNRVLWSLGMETTADLSLTLDVFGDDRDRPSLSTGIGYVLGENFSANLSYALQFERPRIRSLGLGVKLVF